jgi:hypothetical protein
MIESGVEMSARHPTTRSMENSVDTAIRFLTVAAGGVCFLVLLLVRFL